MSLVLPDNHTGLSLIDPDLHLNVMSKIQKEALDHLRSRAKWPFWAPSVIADHDGPLK